MALKVVNPEQFESVFNLFTDAGTLFVIPSFQRPYAWEEKQLSDLFRDMEKACRPDGYHYISAFHLVKLDLATLFKPQSSAFSDFLDVETNSALKELKALDSEGQARNVLDQALQVYAVIDGQQRLTTLYMLAHMYAARCNPGLFGSLYVKLKHGKEVPRLIQNPSNDHTFLTTLLATLRATPPTLGGCEAASQSQERMRDNARLVREWAFRNQSALEFFRSEAFKTSMILLEPKYGLTSFLTLNDRGKPLTVLEKFKALLLQFAFDAKDPGLISRLHSTFGQLYSALNVCTFHKLFRRGSDGDAELMQLISCYVRMDKDRECIWQAAETAYADYFRTELLKSPTDDVTILIERWLNSIKELAAQLLQLERYLSGELGNQPSIHFPQYFLLSDDYRATLLALGLQPHILALMLKFRALYGCEWHEQLPIQSHINPELYKPIQDLIEDVRRRAQGKPQDLLKYLDDLACHDWQPRNALSMLQVTERIQLLNWNLGSRWYQTFVDWCRATIDTRMTVEDFVGKWASWCGPMEFIKNVLTGYNEPNFKFLLKEYERALGQNLHVVPPSIAAQGLEFEHVFAQSIDTDPHFNTLGGFTTFDFKDRDDFVQNMLSRSGNLSWLSKSANDSLGNATPDIKAAHYRACLGHPNGSSQNICSDIRTVKRLGDQLVKLGMTYSAYRLQLEARCAELANFALTRFV